MTAQTLLLASEREELKDLAGRIRAWQDARKLSQAEMLRRFPGLGSDRTYVRIQRGDTEDLDIERQLASYRAVAAAFDSATTR